MEWKKWKPFFLSLLSHIKIETYFHVFLIWIVLGSQWPCSFVNVLLLYYSTGRELLCLWQVWTEAAGYCGLGVPPRARLSGAPVLLYNYQHHLHPCNARLSEALKKEKGIKYQVFIRTPSRRRTTAANGPALCVGTWLADTTMGSHHAKLVKHFLKEPFRVWHYLIEESRESILRSNVQEILNTRAPLIITVR